MERNYRVKAEVDLEAIKYNINSVRRKADAKTKIMVIVKADAYGHGAVQASKALSKLADAYGVAIPEEGVELRKNYIDKPVLILGYTDPEKYDVLLSYNLTPSIFTYEDALKFSYAALRFGKIADIHIAVDTGMSRIGFSPDESSLSDIVKISSLPNIAAAGIFTHFATADCADKSAVYEQKRKFDLFYDMLCKKGVKIPLRHISNSAAIMEMDCDYEMVRSGIVTYGLYPSSEVDRKNLDIKPAMSLKARISYVKNIEKGTRVGYGGTFTAKRKTVLATVPVGYADGYPFALANKGFVLVHGKKAAVAGRICMDQFMIDVTDIENVKTGDEAVLLGTQGGDRITADEIASLVGSINYELVCGISKRVPREYL